jgi:hypothetical protein
MMAIDNRPFVPESFVAALQETAAHLSGGVLRVGIDCVVAGLVFDFARKDDLLKRLVVEEFWMSEVARVAPIDVLRQPRSLLEKLNELVEKLAAKLGAAFRPPFGRKPVAAEV